MVKLGSLVRDNITGFKGMAIERVVFLHGCVQIQVQPITLASGTGKPRDVETFDEQRVVVTSSTEQSDEYNGANLAELYPLGGKAKDTLTGFEGLVVGQLNVLFGTDMIGIQPMKLEGSEIAKTVWFDLPRVEMIKVAAPKVSKNSSSPNGAMTKFKSPTHSRPAGRR